jgi:hypothetical protein
MANFILRYRLTESQDGGSKRKSYTVALLVPASTKEEAEQIVRDCYVDTQETNYDINFL